MDIINKTIGTIGVLTLISGVWVYGQTPSLDKVPAEEYIKTEYGLDYYQVIKTTYDDIEQRVQELLDENLILEDEIITAQNKIDENNLEISKLNSLK